MRLNISIDGMSCEHCIHAVQTSLNAIPGVTCLDVKIGNAQIEISDVVDRKDLASAIDEEGYVVTAINEA